MHHKKRFEDWAKQNKVEYSVTKIMDSSFESVYDLKLTLNGLPYRYSSNAKNAEEDMYQWMLHQVTKTVIDKLVDIFNNAKTIAWMKNIEQGKGDSNGETIPSNKQIIDQLYLGEEITQLYEKSSDDDRRILIEKYPTMFPPKH